MGVPKTLGVLALAAVLCGTAREGAAEGGPAPRRGELSIYLSLRRMPPDPPAGTGPRGLVLQADLEGNVLGRVELPGEDPGYALAFRREGAIADRRAPWCLLVAQTDVGVAKVNSRGETATLIPFRQPGKPDAELVTVWRRAIGIAVDPTSGDILVADNLADDLLLYKGWPPGPARVLHHLAGTASTAQDMDLACARDGTFLFSTDDPKGTYRFHPGEPEPLRNLVSPADGEIAADPASAMWASASGGGHALHVFEGDKETQALAFPAGKRPTRSGSLSWGPGGLLVVPLVSESGLEFVEADLKRRAFLPLFTWDDRRLAELREGWTARGTSFCIAVGPRMPWIAQAAPAKTPPPGK